VILHLVLIKPRPGIEPGSVERLHRAVVGLAGEIPGIVDVRFGANVSPEGLGRGFAHGFVMTFVDTAARDAYLPHPAHRRILPLVEALAAEVLVFDIAG